MTNDIATGDPKSGSPPAPKARQNGGLFAPVQKALEAFGGAALLAGQTLLMIVRGRLAFRDLLAQMSAIGADSLGIVLIITTATGAVFALYATRQAVQYGLGAYVGGGIAYTFFNELGPVLGGVALASRSGAAIAAEIGSMVVTEQVDALRAMAVSPIRYLVAPRVLAAIIMLPLLTIIADVSGLFGGLFTASLGGVTSSQFFESVRSLIRTQDVTNGLIKALVFGFLIGITSCMQGLLTSGGATGVGRSTTRSVVLCVIFIFVSDVFLAQLLTGR